LFGTILSPSKTKKYKFRIGYESGPFVAVVEEQTRVEPCSLYRDENEKIMTYVSAGECKFRIGYECGVYHSRPKKKYYSHASNYKIEESYSF